MEPVSPSLKFSSAATLVFFNDVKINKEKKDFTMWNFNPVTLILLLPPGSPTPVPPPSSLLVLLPLPLFLLPLFFILFPQVLLFLSSLPLSLGLCKRRRKNKTFVDSLYNFPFPLSTACVRACVCVRACIYVCVWASTVYEITFTGRNSRKKNTFTHPLAKCSPLAVIPFGCNESK